MKNNASTINSNLKQFWIAMGGKEDIAYNNCRFMLAKFKELILCILIPNIQAGIHGPFEENNLFNFAQVLFK